MAGELVFITGATGFIGFAVLVDLLKAGYRARVSVRKQNQIAVLKEHVLIRPSASKVEFVVVPDITAEGAFDTVLKDVHFVQHIASPLPNPESTDPERDIIIPAIHGTTSILDSALLTPTVRRIVITSSIVAVIPGSALANGDPTTVYTAASRVRPLPSAPWGNFSSAYRAAKVLALDATERFIEEKKPHFAVVNVMPGYVIGRNELVTDAEALGIGSNGIPFSIMKGVLATGARPGSVTDLRDVVRVQVASLDEIKVVGNRSFALDVGHVVFNDLNNVARKAFPKEAETGVLPLGGSIDAVWQNVDVRETVEVFGPMRSYEDMVSSFLEQYLELKTKALP